MITIFVRIQSLSHCVLCYVCISIVICSWTGQSVTFNIIHRDCTSSWQATKQNTKRTSRDSEQMSIDVTDFVLKHAINWWPDSITQMPAGWNLQQYKYYKLVMPSAIPMSQSCVITEIAPVAFTNVWPIMMFSLICASINGWANNREAGDLKPHRAHNDVIVMVLPIVFQALFRRPVITWHSVALQWNWNQIKTKRLCRFRTNNLKISFRKYLPYFVKHYDVLKSHYWKLQVSYLFIN